jgi:hypothetical protein
MQQTDIDTSIYEAVKKGYKGSGLGLGKLANLAREVEAELNAWYDMSEEQEDLIR